MKLKKIKKTLGKIYRRNNIITFEPRQELSFRLYLIRF